MTTTTAAANHPSERVALVTGGSRGIGLAIAKALSRDGYGVTIAARTAASLQEARVVLETDGATVNAVVADASVEEDVARLLASHRSTFGRLDVLVNNAGSASAGPVATLDLAALSTLLDSNLRSAFLVTREATEMLRFAGAEHKRALVINLGSIVGVYGQGGLAAYSAAKAGVIALSQALHGEFAGTGVRVSALSPAFVATQMTGFLDIPREELIQPEDVAEAVRFLARTSPACVVPEIQFIRPTDRLLVTG